MKFKRPLSSKAIALIVLSFSLAGGVLFAAPLPIFHAAVRLPATDVAMLSSKDQSQDYNAAPEDFVDTFEHIFKRVFGSPSIYDSVLFTPQDANNICVNNTVLLNTQMQGVRTAEEIINAANAGGINPLFIFGIAGKESSFCTAGWCETGEALNNPYGIGCSETCAPACCTDFSSWASATTSATNILKDLRDNYGATTMEDLVCGWTLGPNSSICQNDIVTQNIRSYVATVVGIMDKLQACVEGGMPSLPAPGTPGVPQQIHRICLDKRCVAVTGPGIDRCSNDGDCFSTHTTCLGNSCILAYEPGKDECILPVPGDTDNPNNNDLIGFPGKCPTPKHRECVGDGLGKRCAVVPGSGPDTCTSDTKCEDPPEPPDIPFCVFQCIDKDSCLNSSFNCTIVDGSCTGKPDLFGGVCCRCLNQDQGRGL